MVRLSDGGKKSEDTINRFDRMYERDRQTPHDARQKLVDIPRSYCRNKNVQLFETLYNCSLLYATAIHRAAAGYFKYTILDQTL